MDFWQVSLASNRGPYKESYLQTAWFGIPSSYELFFFSIMAQPWVRVLDLREGYSNNWKCRTWTGHAYPCCESWSICTLHCRVHLLSKYWYLHYWWRLFSLFLWEKEEFFRMPIFFWRIQLYCSTCMILHVHSSLWKLQEVLANITKNSFWITIIL